MQTIEIAGDNWSIDPKQFYHFLACFAKEA
jgi:hypothetical protein